MKQVITGNDAVAWGVQLAQAQVIPVYPITPQTAIAETLAQLCDKGQLHARFIKVESEHSAMAACIAASLTGVRTFTATSSQGLLYMHELLWWAAGARAPVVMANVNRAVALPWSIWGEQTDSLAQRDTGWLQFYCASAQEALDTVLQAYRIAEAVYLPAMINLDAYILSHTDEPVDIPEPEIVSSYLPPYRPAFRLDPKDPKAIGTPADPSTYMEFRYKEQEAMEQALVVADEAIRDYARLTGRYYPLVEGYCLEDAEEVLIAIGSVASTARLTVDALRAEGRRAGVLRLRCLRPFPSNQIRQALVKARKVAVFDRDISFGHCGILALEIRAALYDLPQRPAVFGFIAGLGGRDITPVTLRQIFDYAAEREAPEREQIWIGLNR